jgi:hypothetical protein
MNEPAYGTQKLTCLDMIFLFFSVGQNNVDAVYKCLLCGILERKNFGGRDNGGDCRGMGEGAGPTKVPLLRRHSPLTAWTNSYLEDT